MNSRTAAASAFLVVICAGAHAADLRVPDAPPPRLSWAGPYLGAHIGGALDRSDLADLFGAPLLVTRSDRPARLDGETDAFLIGNIQKQTFAAEQAAAFVQASYKFDVSCCAWLVK